MVAVTLMWSSAGVVSRHLEQTRSFEVTFWRSFFTLLSLALLFLVFRGKNAFKPLINGGWVLWISGFFWACMFTSYMVALMLTTVANVLITMSLIPLITALGSWAFAGHRITPRTWLAVAVAGVGIALMYAQQINLGTGLLGSLVALVVPLAGSANWTLTQFSQRHGQQVDLIPAVFIGAVIASLVTLPLAWPFQANAHDLGLLAGLGLFQLAIPCTLAVICSRTLPAPEMALLGLLEVIFGIALAWLGAGEAPAPLVLLGGALVIGALVSNELWSWKLRGV
jgi:drug/metabolite transporter (DMT)-like permease